MSGILDNLPAPRDDKVGWPWTVETNPNVYSSRADWPTLTVVTPSFNQGRFIEETIRSVLLQNYPNLEYFVMDGGSTDGTTDIIRKYGEWIAGWVSETDGGQGSAINRGFRRGTGDILAWLNSDDVYYGQALRCIMAEVVDFPDHVAYVGSCDKVDLQGRIISTVVPRKLRASDIADWHRSGFFYQPACFFRRSAFEQVGGINEMYQNALDIDLWVKLAQKGTFKTVDATIAHAKIHHDMKTLKDIPLRNAETAAVALAFGYREAALRRLGDHARYYMRNEASLGSLIDALAGRIVSYLRAVWSRQ